METPHVPPTAVLVAVDGSSHADRAVRWAARHAGLASRPLVAVHAGDATQFNDDGRRWEPDQVVAAAVALARATAPGVEATGVVLPGDPRSVLVDLSSRVPLVVMGSRGRGAFRSLLLGSTSSGVANHARCPVVVVRDPDEDVDVRRVVVGVDGTPESRTVVETAYRLASLHRVGLLVVHCYWDVLASVSREAERPPGDPGAAELAVGVSELLAGLAEDHPDVEARVVLRHGLVDTVLVNSALPGDVVVVGRHVDRSPAQFLTGSVATAVLERAAATVVVVPQVEGPTDGEG